MILFPNAKINIGLDILSRRPDGYHEIATLMYPTAWRDVLELVPGTSGKDTLTCYGRPVLCPPEKNLVMKALRSLRDVVPFGPVDCYLDKIIPDGAGLGGGSADAAFTIKGVNELMSLGLTDEELAAVAARVGADCPFFIYNRPMMACGIGEKLTPVDLGDGLSSMFLLIAKPRTASVPTAQAYAGVTPRLPGEKLEDRLRSELATWRQSITNAFEESVFPLHPHVEQLKRSMYQAGASFALMSGSGASVYGIFDSKRDCIKLRDTLTESCDTFMQKL
ncbi:MAG: 4-(cytidine 5'-diphospho)-2-C-methyl-D-erythritol kinase [Muribaculaceae bacterium]|nr:4-(cytidine 5'-diphospho)-2-C-methyl-D-erythritol kinase [Muribaculaceae bacterium]